MSLSKDNISFLVDEFRRFLEQAPKDVGYELRIYPSVAFGLQWVVKGDDNTAAVEEPRR